MHVYHVSYVISSELLPPKHILLLLRYSARLGSFEDSGKSRFVLIYNVACLQCLPFRDMIEFGAARAQTCLFEQVPIG
jgi:hypothetical protein